MVHLCPTRGEFAFGLSYQGVIRAMWRCTPRPGAHHILHEYFHSFGAIPSLERQEAIRRQTRCVAFVPLFDVFVNAQNFPSAVIFTENLV